MLVKLADRLQQMQTAVSKNGLNFAMKLTLSGEAKSTHPLFSSFRMCALLFYILTCGTKALTKLKANESLS